MRASLTKNQNPAIWSLSAKSCNFSLSLFTNALTTFASVHCVYNDNCIRHLKPSLSMLASLTKKPLLQLVSHTLVVTPLFRCSATITVRTCTEKFIQRLQRCSTDLTDAYDEKAQRICKMFCTFSKSMDMSLATLCCSHWLLGD